MAADSAARRIVFLGPPNSGKGTQAARLAGELGVPAISTGEMLRAAVDAGTDLGRRVEGVMAKGHLVSDDLMADVVRDRLEQLDARGGYILDGYPRTLPQVEMLEKILDGSPIEVVLMVDAPHGTLIERALKRGRTDDTEEIVRERLRVYRRDTAPLESHYDQAGLLRRIDGAQTMDHVEAQIRETLRETRGAA